MMLFKNILKAQNLTLCLCFMLFAGTLLGAFSSTVRAQSPVYATNNAGQTEIRMQQLETQIRELTGQVETQSYEINSLNQKVKMLEGKTGETHKTEVIRPQIQPLSQPSFIEQDVVPSGRMGADLETGLPPMPGTATSGNALGLDFSAQDPQGMQTKTVIGGGDADATSQYERAYADLKLSNYEQAQRGFEDFLRVHGDHILAANAQYWLGESFYVRNDFAQSARAFAQGFQTYPDSAKSPDILLKLGLSLKGLGKNREACVALKQVPVKFPIGHDEIIERAEQERQNLSCET